MRLNVHDYVNRTRHPVWERELATRLRQISEEERLEFIREWLPYDLSLALLFAHKCLQRRSSFYWILQHSLHHADASSIKWYLKCVVPRVGFRRTVAYLNKELPRNPDAVRNALYWLPQFLSESDERGKEALSALRNQVFGYPIDIPNPDQPGRVLFRFKPE